MSNKPGDLVLETHEDRRVSLSLFDMLNFLSPLMVLLSLVGINSGQDFGGCSYRQDVEPGKQYFVFNTNYPQNYPRGSTCRWVAQSDRPIRLSCSPFSVPSSYQCSQDALIIQDGDAAAGHRYCGDGNIDLVSKSNKLIITLTTSKTSSGGKFLCSLQTDQSPDDNNCRCGWKNPTRIVGGEETGVNEYPMMCGLIDAQLGILFCGATIINERQVVTAAHCVKNRPTDEIGVLIGDHDLSSGSETNATKLLRVESYSVHPRYNPGTQDYDIAVVTIVDKMTFNQQVGPVCLPFQHSPDTFGGAPVEVLGWGSSEFAGGPSNTLQKARLNVVTNAVCSQTNKDLSTRQLCTEAPGKDSCQFDSGGPVLWQNPTTRRIVEIGIISFGSVCADGEPAVNTRLGAFVGWIQQQTPRGITYCKAE